MLNLTYQEAESFIALRTIQRHYMQYVKVGAVCVISRISTLPLARYDICGQTIEAMEYSETARSKKFARPCTLRVSINMNCKQYQLNMIL